MVVASDVLLSSSCPCHNVIIAGPLPRLKAIVVGLVARLACSTAHRRVPDAGLLAGAESDVLVTVNVERSRRSSNARSDGRDRWRSRLVSVLPGRRTETAPVAVPDYRCRFIPIFMVHLVAENECIADPVERPTVRAGRPDRWRRLRSISFCPRIGPGRFQEPSGVTIRARRLLEIPEGRVRGHRPLSPPSRSGRAVVDPRSSTRSRAAGVRGSINLVEVIAALTCKVQRLVIPDRILGISPLWLKGRAT